MSEENAEWRMPSRKQEMPGPGGGLAWPECVNR